MGLVEDIERILEAPYSQYVGAMGRPDPDYVGYAYKRHPIKSADGFPYDRDDDGGVMTLNRVYDFGRDRGSGNHEPMVAPLTAKSKGRTAKSGFEEAAGTPVNQTIGSRGGSETGNPAPGAGGGRGWSGAPTHPWDDDEDEQRWTAIYGKDALESREVSPERVPNQEPPDGLVPDDGHSNSDFDSFPSVLMQVLGSGFGSGLGRSNPSGRGFMNGWTEDLDVLASEGAWSALARLLKI